MQMRIIILALGACLMCSLASPTHASILVRSTKYNNFRGYGTNNWTTMSSYLDQASNTQITVASFLSDAAQVAAADALWIDVGPINGGSSGYLTSEELSNISDFMATGRRVVFIGEHGSWSDWNNQMLNIFGSQQSSGWPTGSLDTVADHDLTVGVSAIHIGTGYATLTPRGLQLFEKNVATVWDGNVVTLLDSNILDDNNLPLEDNDRFARNLANWISQDVNHPVPEPTTIVVWSLLGVVGMTITRRRR